MKSTSVFGALLSFWMIGEMVGVVFGFPLQKALTGTRSRQKSMSAFSNHCLSTALQAAADKKATLTEETTWRLRLNLDDMRTAQNRKVGETFVVEVQFSEDMGYEPPQGGLKQIPASPEEVGTRILEISDGRWKLSEDPNERKDGLWVWGLFKEPLYPFLLLQIKTKALDMPGNEGDFIQPMTLYAQINHKRDDELGVVLKGPTPLTIREVESIKADPFGAASVDIYEEFAVGEISFQPVNVAVESKSEA